jgi:hypothetical protein
MYEGVALFYGLLTTYVMTSASQSRRTGRKLSNKVVLLGWALASASITLGIVLLGYEAAVAMLEHA